MMRASLPEKSATVPEYNSPPFVKKIKFQNLCRFFACSFKSILPWW
jgi:hypothetical protein